MLCTAPFWVCVSGRAPRSVSTNSRDIVGQSQRSILILSKFRTPIAQRPRPRFSAPIGRPPHQSRPRFITPASRTACSGHWRVTLIGIPSGVLVEFKVSNF